MTTSSLADAFAHHVWATERIIDSCMDLTAEEMATPVPGTFGSVISTLRHLVSADCWYLSFFTVEPTVQIDEGDDTSLADLRSANAINGEAWTALLNGGVDPDLDVVEHGPDGSEYHARAGVRLAQVIHHGTDHRSQVCTALSSLGRTPPEIDVWSYADATGRAWEVPAPAR